MSKPQATRTHIAFLIETHGTLRAEPQNDGSTVYRCATCSRLLSAYPKPPEPKILALITTNHIASILSAAYGISMTPVEQRRVHLNSNNRDEVKREFYIAYTKHLQVLHALDPAPLDRNWKQALAEQPA